MIVIYWHITFKRTGSDLSKFAGGVRAKVAINAVGEYDFVAQSLGGWINSSRGPTHHQHSTTLLGNETKERA